MELSESTQGSTEAVATSDKHVLINDKHEQMYQRHSLTSAWIPLHLLYADWCIGSRFLIVVDADWLMHAILNLCCPVLFSYTLY